MRLEPSPDRGFTLLETLLALAIGGLVLTAAYGAVVRAAAARDGATRRTAGVARARLALLEMAHTIESATRRPFAADTGELRIALADPEPRLVRYALDGSRLLEQRTNLFATATDGCRGTEAPRAVELTIRVADGEELRTRVVLALGGGS
jgi:prepilin-type N-terminal cleavage/methylation domain-containing protein